MSAIDAPFRLKSLVRAGLLLALLTAFAVLPAVARTLAAPDVAVLEIGATVPPNLCPGDSITYTLTLINAASGGPSLAAMLNAPIPANADYVADSATNGARFDPDQNEVSWIGEIPPSQGTVVIFAVQLQSGLPNGTQIVQDASAIMGDPAGGSTTDTAQHTATVNCPATTATPTATPTQPPITLPTHTPTPTVTNTPPVFTLPTNTPTPPVFTLPTNTPTATATPYVYDIRITGMEITQGTQNLDNNMPLIRDRRTIVRVYVEEASGKDLSNVKARLQGRRTANDTGVPVNEALVTLFPQNSPLVLADGSDRLTLGDSFWFYLPSSWRSGTVEFTAQVNYDNAFNEANLTNNQRQVTRTFRTADPLNVLFFPMRVRDGGSNDPVLIYYCDEDPRCADLYRNALRRHPISQMNVWFAQEPLKKNIGEWQTNDEDMMAKMLKKLNWTRVWHVNPPASSLHYYGALHPDLRFLPDGGNKFSGGWGLGRRPGWVVTSYMFFSQSNETPWWIPLGNTVAHELGHNRGLLHVACADNNDDGVADEIAGGAVDASYPWPFPNCRIAAVDPEGYYGMDVYYGAWGLGAPTVISNDPAATAPNRGWPMMGYQNPRWISPWEYCKLMPTYGVSCNLSWGTRSAQTGPSLQIMAGIDALQNASEFLLVGGEFDLSAHTVELDPAYRLSELAPSQLARAVADLQARQDAVQHTARFHNEHILLVLEDAQGRVLASRRLEVDGGHDSSPSQDHPHSDLFTFVEVMPFPEDTAWIRIRDDEDALLYERAVSNNSPQVNLTSPNSGNIAPGTEITWTASDPDGDELVYTVLYSHDAGVSWLPLALDLTETSLTLTPGLIHDIPGSDQGMIRVIASDGVNTGEDTSDGLLSAANTPPNLLLANQERTLSLAPGHLLILDGSATDVEDGVLDGESLVWESSLDGELGTGRELATNALSEGVHTITLTATDSQGASSEATLTVVVRLLNLYLPSVSR